MPRLVPLDATCDRAFVDGLQRAWDAGDAVFPVDPRLPRAARDAALASARVDEPVEPGDALVVTTSGSTGAPKAVVLTHEALAASTAGGNARLGVDPARDRWLACLPLAHMGGLNVVVRALRTGTPLDLLPRFDAAAVDAAAAAGATLTSLVPTAFARIDARRWRRILLGGAAPPAGLPGNVVTTYGLTETCGGCVYDGVPFPGVEVRVVGGEVQVRGPVLLRCYRDGRDPKTPDGWFPTGDAGAFDGGRLVVHGRLGDLIVTGGEKVWPAPVERVLRTHAGVAECAVAGRPDAEWGQRVVAFVVPADRAAPPSLDDLREHVKAELGPWCAPRELVVVDDLPRTASGKVRPPT